MPLTCADIIVESLIANGVDTIFGLPGVQTYGLFDALARHKDQIKVIGTRHEQGAAYMAFGYARASQRIGAYAVVPGPGVLNTTAALCTAFGTNSQVLCLTGQVPSAFIGKGRGHLHELPDQLLTLRSIAKWGARINGSGEAAPVMEAAFQEMLSGRQGPVAVETPWDVFGQPADNIAVSRARPHPTPAPNETDVAAMADAIARARNPMIFVGGGALNARKEVTALAERLGAPVVAFRSGRGIVAEDSDLSANIVAAYTLWHDTDLLIGIGTRLEVPYLRWPYRPKGLKLARIDIDPLEMGRLPRDVGLVADARDGLQAILDALGKQDAAALSRRDAIHEAKAKTQPEIAKIQPHTAYLDVIRKALPHDGLLVEELCQAGYASYFAYPVYEPRTYISCGYQGTLGFGFMTALGAKVANPDKPVVSITGDGGFMFGVQELATAVQYGIGVVTIIFDNGGFGNVRRDQKTRFGGRVIAAELCNPDFVALAESFGAAGHRVDSPDALAPVLRRTIAADRPAIIHIPVDPDSESSPWPLIIPAPPADRAS